jgi:hypothetical protein
MEFRSAPRHLISDCSDLKVALCAVGPAPEQKRTPVRGPKLWDLGPEGASFLCPLDRWLLALPINQHLKLVLTYRGEEIYLDGELVQRTKIAGRAVSLQMSFVDSLRGSEGRAQVPKLVERLRDRGLVRDMARRIA